MNEWITKSQRPNKCEHAISFLIFLFCLDAQMKWNAFCRITITMSMLFNAFVLRLFLLLIMNGYGVSFPHIRSPFVENFTVDCCFFGNFLMSTISSEVKWSEMNWNESTKKGMKIIGKKPATGTRCAQTTDAYTKICKKTEETTWDGKSFYADAFNTFSERKIFTDNFLLSCRSRAYISKNWFFFFFSILPLMLIQ